MKVTAAFFDSALGGIATGLAAFHITYFAGPVPGTAGEALDMVNDHTQVAKLTDGNNGTSALGWGSVAGNLLPLDSGVNAEGTIAFSGAEAGESTLVPTFFRIHGTSDDPTADASGVLRIQGTLGGPSSGADIELGSASVTDNGSNTVGLSSYSVSASTLGG